VNFLKRNLISPILFALSLFVFGVSCVLLLISWLGELIHKLFGRAAILLMSFIEIAAYFASQES
jgi:apolipoprotein N-acyltransferase